MTDPLAQFLARARSASGGARVVSLDELVEFRARRVENTEQEPEAWGLDALRGRLVELSARGASACTTTAVSLVLEAQLAAEPAAWVCIAAQGCFYPPDVAAAGVDLSALVVVRARELGGAVRAAEHLLRSGAFGLVVLDLGAKGDLSMPQQGRFVTLAQAHDAALVCLTTKSARQPSLGSLVSLRAEALRIRSGSELSVSVRALKDKRRGPGWSRTIKVRGPAGM